MINEVFYVSRGNRRSRQTVPVEGAQFPVAQRQIPRKRLEKSPEWKHNDNGSLACERMKGAQKMASQRAVKGNLYDDRGTWTYSKALLTA